MRELKFRAWSKKHNKYLKITGIQYDGDKFAGTFVIYGTVAGIPNTIFLKPEDVVLEQYTGLKDKNGKEIYEGDILESTWNGDKADVVWNNVEGEWEHYADFNAYSKYGSSVVIGNIHENPELLGDTNVTNKEEE